MNYDKFLKFIMLEKQNTEDKNIAEVVYNLQIPKSSSIQSPITTLLIDVRSITRVTTAQSEDSYSLEGEKVVEVRIRFNTKNLNFEGYASPKEFVNRVITPIIQRLDTHPRILSISSVGKPHRRKKR